MKRWWIRFGVRILLYGGGLYGMLRLTASRFDVTEWNAILLFVATMIAVEGTMAVLAGNWPERRRRGRTPWPIALLVGLVVFGAAAARPSGSEVSVTYRGKASFLHLALLAEINRWP